jgi:predicted dehydrogenase
MARISVGVIGAGKHGQRYLQHLREDIPELSLAAFSRRDSVAGAALARSLGVAFHADWHDLVADPAIEAVVAVVPPTLHPSIAAAVGAARKPLLIEKPLAATGATARDVARSIRASGVACLMAHTLRWNTVVRAVRDRLPELGPLRALHLNQRFEPSSLGWIDDPAVSGGGIILHTGVHSFDLVRWLTGREVVRVSCRVLRADTRRTEDNFVAILELDGGAPLVTVSGSRSTGGRSGLIDIAGARGQLVGDHALGFAYGVRGLERSPLVLPGMVPTVREALGAFARLLVAGEPPPVSIDDGARAVLIADACRASAEAGEPRPVTPLEAV